MLLSVESPFAEPLPLNDQAYRRTRKAAAVGVDGVTAEEYEQDLEGNLQHLSTAQSPVRTRLRLCGECTFRRAVRLPKLAH